MKKLKTIFAIVIVFIFAIQFSAIALAAEIPSPKADFYVNDFAGIFSEEEKQVLMEKAVKLANENDGIQVVVTTIKSLDGMSVEKYATTMYNTYQIGKNDMGILILLSTEDRRARVEVGNAMEAYITDSKAGSYLDKYAIPYLKNNEFNKGLIELQSKLIDEVIVQVNKEKNAVNETKVVPAVSKQKESLNINWGKVLMTSGFVLLAIVLAVGIALAVIRVIEKSKVKKLEEARKLKDLERKAKEASEKYNLSTQENERLTRNYEEKAKGLLEQIDEQARDYEKIIKGIKSENEGLKERNASFSEFSRVVHLLYPEIDKEVKAKQAEEKRNADIAAAKPVDELLGKFSGKKPNKDLVKELEIAKESYNALTIDQRFFLKNNISVVNSLYAKSKELLQEFLREEKIKKDKKEADSIQRLISNVVSRMSSADEDDYSKLNSLKKEYENASSDVKGYIDTKLIRQLQLLFNQSSEDKKLKSEIRSASEKLERVIRSSYGKSSEIGELESILSYYRMLPSRIRTGIDRKLPVELEDLLEDAKRDKRRKEEEEERRRRSYSSSSSFGSSSYSGFGGSHHSGFGGHSSGGGASRGF